MTGVWSLFFNYNILYITSIIVSIQLLLINDDNSYNNQYFFLLFLFCYTNTCPVLQHIFEAESYLHLILIL